VHLTVAAVVRHIDNVRDVDRQQPDDFGAAQEALAETAPPGNLLLLPAFGDGTFDRRREAVLQDLEDDSRGRRPDAVDTWQGTGVEQFG
jgi:hypothetical protein